MPNDIRVLVRPYGGGPQTDYSDVACPTLQITGKSPTGDADIQWVQKSNAQPGLMLPDPYSVVSLIDVGSGAEFRRFRTCPWSIANWDCQYSGPLTIQGEGLAASMQDHTFGEINSSTHNGSVVFGPTLIKNMIRNPAAVAASAEWLMQSTASPFVQAPDVPILALTPEDAIRYAVGMLCSDVTVGPLATTGIIFDRPTGDFMLANAQRVVDDMSALLGHLATPLLWHVRAGVLDWLPMDMGPKYQVSLEDGAKLTSLRFDPKQIRNRAHIGYGKNQVATPTDAIDHRRIPITRDLPIHLGGEINEYATALQLGEGVLAQQQAFPTGWSFTLSIPRNCPIIEIATGQRIKPHMVQEGHGVRILALGGERLTANPFLQPPMVHFMNEVRFDNGTGTLTVTCGQTAMQAQGAATRGIVQQSEHLKSAALDLWQNTYGKYDGSKVPFGGPAINSPTNAELGYSYGHVPLIGKPGSGTISPIETVPPQMTPPRNPPGSFYPLIPLATADTGPPLGIPPVKVTGWEIYCNVDTTAVFQFVLMSTGETLFTADASGGTTTPAGVVTSQAFNDPVTGQGPLNVNPGPGAIVRIDHDDALGLVCTTGDANTAITWLCIVLRFEPLYPGYGNTARDAATREAVFQNEDVGTPLGEDLA